MYPFLVVAALVAPPVSSEPFAALRFLEGEWIAEGGPAGTSGSFSFSRALDGKILLRKNLARLPGRDGVMATHEDLLVVFQAPQGGLGADYYDNEGHLIRYTVEATEVQVRFLSNGPGPRFRLTYLPLSKDSVEVRFEIAPPDKPEAFSLYLSGKARRVH